ncbi:MAG: hypothetical protein ACE5ID_02875 [Acidobacteriota bacterium]
MPAVLAMGLTLAPLQAAPPGEGLDHAEQKGVTDSPSGRPDRGAMSAMMERMKKRFEAASPAVGEPVPDLTVYNGDGKEVSLRDLVRGHFTVLVLGCLT